MSGATALTCLSCRSTYRRNTQQLGSGIALKGAGCTHLLRGTACRCPRAAARPVTLLTLLPVPMGPPKTAAAARQARAETETGHRCWGARKRSV